MAKKEFKLTNIAVSNRTTVYFMTVFLALFGILTYVTTPKENFPEVDVPFIMIMTSYPGASPVDVENLITQPIEKELKGINGVKDISSKSIQDFSTIFIEFEMNVNEDQGYLDVTEAVDKVLPDLPNDLEDDPEVKKIEFSEFPILNINLSGDLSMVKLKAIADDLQDEIEALEEITRVDIVGALEREIQVNVDLYRMQAAELTFADIAAAIAGENTTISGGQVQSDGTKRALRVNGEYRDPLEIRNILLKDGVYVKDIAEVVDGFEDRESYARLDGQQVITLDVIKRGGKNLIEGVDKINVLLDQFKQTAPENLVIKITGDESVMIRNSISNLFNTLALGFLVVVLVLMFFMGIDNALFAATAIPLSIVIAFVSLPVLDFTVNSVVLIGFILVLGILVDNSIVVVENIYRHFTTTEDLPILPATKRAVGEVAGPVFTGTLTTMAPFFPLVFWPGIIGRFMYYVPVIIIVTLAASLLVAFTMNPVFAVSFMRYRLNEEQRGNHRRNLVIAGSALGAAVLFRLAGIRVPGNLLLILVVVFLLTRYVLSGLIRRFQLSFVPWMRSTYKSHLAQLLVGKRPWGIIALAILLLIGTFVLLNIKGPRVVLFNQGDPLRIMIYITMPEGTHIDATNEVTRKLERQVNAIVGEDNPDVESIVTNVAVNAGSNIFDREVQDKLAKITIKFVEYKYRTGEKSTTEILNEIRDRVQPIPGAEIVVEEEEHGPPTDPPINIEIRGKDIDVLADVSQRLLNYIDELHIPGIEHLKRDMEIRKPELVVQIDRVKANQLGVSTAAIGQMLRNALYGNEVSKYREGEDQYPIMVRLKREQRHDLDTLLTQNVFVPGEKGGPDRRIPMSTLVKVKDVNTYGGILHKDARRTITLYSNVLKGYNANEILAEIQKALPAFDLPEGYHVAFTGEQEDQAESGAFIMKALVIALGLIFIILVAQFNSIGKASIIMTQIVFSLIGIFWGITIFDIDFSIIMSGLGVVAVGGVVATNGIILIDYLNEMMETESNGMDAVVKAASIRLVPVLLTAMSTILGLLPLACGININFVTLITELNPHIYLGGPDSAFWKPLAWALIFGLGFATFLTLAVEPTMYYLMYGKKHPGGPGGQQTANRIE